MIIMDERSDEGRKDIEELGNVKMKEIEVIVVDIRRVGEGERESIEKEMERKEGRDMIDIKNDYDN